MSEEEDILIGLGAVEQALAKLQERVERIEKLVEKIALGLGINPNE